MNPQALTVLHVLAYGFLHHAQADKAVALLEALDALRPGDPRILLTLATAHLRSGAANRALQVLGQVSSGESTPATTELLRAQALAMLGQHAEARAAMETFLKRHPARAPARYFEE
jgi:predicted Zn-dependent protease